MHTTVKLTVATRERIRALGGTAEETIVEAVEALEAQRFWAQAERAATHSLTMSDTERSRALAEAVEIDAAFDGLD